MVPAKRTGYAGGLSGFQLKLIQEVITQFLPFCGALPQGTLSMETCHQLCLLIAAVAVMFQD